MKLSRTGEAKQRAELTVIGEDSTALCLCVGAAAASTPQLSLPFFICQSFFPV